MMMMMIVLNVYIHIYNIFWINMYLKVKVEFHYLLFWVFPRMSTRSIFRIGSSVSGRPSFTAFRLQQTRMNAVLTLMPHTWIIDTLLQLLLLLLPLFGTRLPFAYSYRMDDVVHRNERDSLTAVFILRSNCHRQCDLALQAVSMQFIRWIHIEKEEKKIYCNFIVCNQIPKCRKIKEKVRK